LRRFLDLKRNLYLCISKIFAKFRSEHSKDNEFYISTAREYGLGASGKLHSMGIVP